MTSGDVAGQVRFLELLGRGFEEVNRHSEALRFFDRAIKLADAEKNCGLPFMAYEGKAQALVAMGNADDAKRVLDDALTKARSQDKRGHEAAILILLASVAEKTGDKNQAIADLENAGQFATSVQFYRMEADAMFELAKFYRDGGDWATAEARAIQGLEASQRVGDHLIVTSDKDCQRVNAITASLPAGGSQSAIKSYGLKRAETLSMRRHKFAHCLRDVSAT